MTIRRRDLAAGLLAVTAIAGCDEDRGPTIPGRVEKPGASAAAAPPAPKTSEGGRAVKVDAPTQGGPPSRAIP